MGGRVGVVEKKHSIECFFYVVSVTFFFVDFSNKKPKK